MADLVPRNNDLFQKGDYPGWSHTEVIGAGVVGDPVKIKGTGRGTTNGAVAIIAGSNTGKAQITLDTFEAIDLNNAVWVDWGLGDVTGSQIDVFSGPITAIRGVSVSGAITFKILM